MAIDRTAVHGTARFADERELRRAELIRPIRPGADHGGALIGMWWQDAHDFEPIRYGGDLHQLIVAGTGGGKFTSAFAPMMFGSHFEDHTVVAVDPKAEIAQLAGPYFEEAFADSPRVHIFDPWDECRTGKTSALNVLDTIRADNPHHVDDARALADAMIFPSGDKNLHWDNTARNFIAAVLLYVALAPALEGKRDLLKVRELVTRPWVMPKAYKGKKRPTLLELIGEMQASDVAYGAVAQGASAMFNREEEERSGIISSIERDTAWIAGPNMAKVLTGPGLDVNEAATNGHKYFIVVHPDYFHTHRAWTRLMITAFAKAFKRCRPDRSGPQHKRWRHIIVDEFATLGEMSFMLNDIAVARGYDIKYHLAVQNLSQLKKAYGDDWESFIGNSFQRFFAVSDIFTADYVAKLLGSATVENPSWTTGTSGGKSFSWGESASLNQGSSNSSGPQFSRSTNVGNSQSRTFSESVSEGWSNSESIGQVARNLMTPDEVRRLGPEDQIIFVRGMHPIQSWRPPYWDAFDGLPHNVTLTAVWATIGRTPESEAERLSWFWQDQVQLRGPVPRLAATDMRALPAPHSAAADAWRLIKTLGPAAAFALLLLIAWLWPNTPKP